MNKSLQGRFRDVIHNNYTLYCFVYMYTQICDENALIWGFPGRIFRQPPTLPNPWLNVHKSTAAMNYFFSNMTI
jgi:hypothetical protein